MSSRLSRAKQDEAVSQFQGITGASSKQAKSLLKDMEWKVDTAVNKWFTDGMTPDSKGGRRVDPAKVEALFTKHADEDGKEISIAGVLSLAQDLSLEMTDVRTTILLAYINFLKLVSTKADFTRGMTELGTDSIEALGTKLSTLAGKMGSDKELFKRVYEYAYVGNLDKGEKALKTAIAVAMLPILLGDRWALSGAFVEFLGTTGERVSKDTWKTLIPFMKVLPTTAALGAYEDDGSWPLVMDDFVEHLRGGSSTAAAAAAGSA